MGETLRVDPTGIEDQDGLDRVQFHYQWTANDGSADTDITGATDSSYILVAADEGKTISVRVSFIDRRGYAESLTSAATDAVTFAVRQQIMNTLPTGEPTISGTDQVGRRLRPTPRASPPINGQTLKDQATIEVALRPARQPGVAG